MQGAFPVKCKEQYIRGFRTGQFSSHLMRIAYVVSTGAEGDFDWLINGKLHRVHTGDLVLFNFADLRMPLLKTRGEQVKIQVLTFPPDSTIDGASLTELYCSFSQNPVIPADQVGSLLPHFQRIWQEYQLQAPLSRESATAALRLLLIDLIRIGREAAPQAAPLRNRTALAQAKLLSEVTAYLRQNLSDDLSLPQVATRFGVSQSSLSKLFRRVLGASFPEYIRQLRVERVISILCDGKTGVLDAAQEAGFGSISGFYKAFSAITGATPGDFLSTAKNAEK